MRLLTPRRKLHVCRYAAAVGLLRALLNGPPERTREFVDVLLEQANATALREQTDDGKQAFVDRLRTDQ